MDQQEFIKAIQDCLDAGVPKREIANEFKVSTSAVDRWLGGRSVPGEIVRKSIVARLPQLKQQHIS